MKGGGGAAATITNSPEIKLYISHKSISTMSKQQKRTPNLKPDRRTLMSEHDPPFVAAKKLRNPPMQHEK